MVSDRTISISFSPRRGFRSAPTAHAFCSLWRGGCHGRAFFAFPPGAALTPEGANLYVAASGVTPSISTDAVVHEGAIESANEDTVQATLDLVVMERQAEMMQKALTVFHTEFNKFATEDLPRV